MSVRAGTLGTFGSQDPFSADARTPLQRQSKKGPDSQSYAPVLLRIATDAYSGSRRTPPLKPWDAASVEREVILYSLPAHHRERYLRTFKDKAVVFIPGLLNFFPGDDFFKRVSAPFQYGGLIIGLAAHHGETSHHGLYSVVGQDYRVIQPNWLIEMEILVKRLHQAFTNPSIRANRAESLVLVGHSKGGLLTYALKRLAQARPHPRDLQRFRDYFPGLHRIPLSDLHAVLDRLQNSHFFLYGTPVEGIPYEGVVEAIDKLFLKGSAHYFTPEFMNQFFTALDGGLSDVDAVIHSRKAAKLGEVLDKDDKLNSMVGNTFTLATRALFHGASLMIEGAAEGDGLVKEPSSDLANLNLLPFPADHLQMVEAVRAADALLHILDDHLSMDHDALDEGEDIILKAALTLIDDGHMDRHLNWLLRNNGPKAMHTREVHNGNLDQRLTKRHPRHARRIIGQRNHFLARGHRAAAEATEVISALALDRGISIDPWKIAANPVAAGASAFVR